MTQALRAAVLFQTGEPLRIVELPVPQLLPGQVLVKIHYSGVCRSQLMEVRGGRGVDKWLPHLLGHEASGVVAAVGDGVTKVGLGDPVILTWLQGIGQDAAPAKYLLDGEVVNSGRVSTFSNFSVVSENRVVRLPEGLSLKNAILFGCALPTGAGLVLNEVRPSKDSTVAVLGLGGVGLSALMATIALGIKKILAIDSNPEKLSFARSIGAHHVLDSAESNLVGQVMELTGGGVDYCVESAGSTRTIELGFALLNRKSGALHFASHPPDGDRISIAPHELIAGKKIFGSWGGACHPDRDVPRLAELFLQSKLSLDHLVNREYPLESINEALNDLEDSKVFRPVVRMIHE
jgi:S-(hydroxymethyl)glutathione dehydrogenase / alcohol dehydrogenase